ncbi:MAG: cytochrome d ubiquinol oxidase subunit II [candidate division Zixibacteria bacterium]|nr:cytochrome d ubiquinol oxidase subunit II [candidate division Zixibacteria bacterium]
MIDLNTTWFILYGVLIIGYAILDGFDLGVGVLHLFAHDNNERRINMNAIGPVWDGNEVWLITAGGALFAAFPPVYATIFSGFYIALMLILAALIFRAVSLEFRSKIESPSWQKLWDWSFGLGSLLPSILFGVAVGNILRGVPIDSQGLYAGSFLGLLNPYSILVGVLSLLMFVMHGALYMTLKTDGELRDRMIRWASGAWIAFTVTYLLVTMYTFFEASYLMDSIFSKPLSWLFLIALLASLAYQPVALKSKLFFRAFLASSVSIASIIGIAAVSIFPILVPSSIDMAFSLTAYNASSTPRALSTMLVIALIGVPIVIAYTIFIYRVFKGKTVLTEESY